MTQEEYPQGRMLKGAEYIEIINEDTQRGNIRFALFDFDGTVSLIRQGWQDVMIPMMVDILADLDTDETHDELHDTVEQFVTRLTGKQTIYQMMELVEHIRKRGGEPKDPIDYKWDYLQLLWQQIEDRVKGLKEGTYTPQQMSVPGALDMLAAMKQRGVTMFLASGTDRPYVLDEAACLGVDEYFGDNIYGAIDDYENYSKAMVIQDDIIGPHDLHGSQFVGFGDGYVEIENTKQVGGVAVGLAVDEEQRKGIDEWKRNRLIQYGADIIVPDFREYDKLLQYLFDEV